MNKKNAITRTTDAEILLGLKDIKSDAVFFKDGEAIGILNVTPIDFDHLTSEKQDEVMYFFLEFLNSLDFPVQAMIKRTKRDRTYYFIIPAERRIDGKEAASLEKRCKHVIKAFSAFGMRTKRLSTKQLLSLYAPYFAKDFSLQEYASYIKTSQYHRIIAINEFPRIVDPGWLKRIMQTNTDFEFVMHIAPEYTDLSIPSPYSFVLEKEVREQAAYLGALRTKGKPIPKDLESKHEGTKKLLDYMLKGRERMLDMNIYMDVTSKDLKGLEEATKRMRSMMNAIKVTSIIPANYMYPALRSVLPIGHNELGLKKKMTTSGAAASFPFIKLR